LDHERKVPQIGVNEDGRDDYTTQKDEEKSDAETLKLNDQLNLIISGSSLFNCY
jgi:hypothetical protein